MQTDMKPTHMVIPPDFIIPILRSKGGGIKNHCGQLENGCAGGWRVLGLRAIRRSISGSKVNV
jgi:hypothetical protein